MYFIKFFSLLILMSFPVMAGPAISASRYQLLSGSKSIHTKQFWDQKFSDKSYLFGKSPAKFLARNYRYLPSKMRILDVGMGEGRNAVFLARKGHLVTGIDISSIAIKKSHLLAKEYQVKIKSINASLDAYSFTKNSFDVIICFYFVDRSLNNKMISWLRPGGFLIYESYTDLQKSVRGHEDYEKKYLLREGELLQMFRGMKVLKYEEPRHQKNFRASVILQKPFSVNKN